jgi:Cu/Ag efflux pump CusA
MPEFSIRNPFFIIVVCLVLLVIGSTSLVRMQVDLFPSINLPEVVVESPRPHNGDLVPNLELGVIVKLRFVHAFDFEGH